MQADITKVKKILGFKIKMDFEKGMNETINWAKNFYK